MAETCESEIAIKARACLILFLDSLNVLKATNHDSLWNFLTDQRGRLHLWISNIGVFANYRASLDYRLRELSDYRDLIIEILQGVHDCLDKVMTRCEEEILQLKLDWKEEMRPDSDPINISDGEETYALRELLLTITDSIDWLHRLSNSIRKASSSRHDQRAKKYPLTDPNDPHETDLTHIYKNIYSGLIKREFPGLNMKLRERVAESILIRRKRMTYQLSRQRRWALPRDAYTHEAPENPILLTETTSTRIASLKRLPEVNVSLGKPRINTASQQTATTIQPDRLRHPKVHSNVSSSFTSLSNIHQKELLPPPPTAAKKGKDFICPYCCIILPHDEGLDRRKWERHVQKDLDAYICLFDDCGVSDTNLPLFSTQKDWLDHMRTDHCMRWYCVVDNHGPYSSEEQFIEHMRVDHSGYFDDENLKYIASSSARPSEYILGPNCPFCSDLPADPVIHIGNHLKYLALHSLPMLEDAENSDLESFSGKDDSFLNLSQSTDTMAEFAEPLSQGSGPEFSDPPMERLLDESVPDEELLEDSLEYSSKRLMAWGFLPPLQQQHDRLKFEDIACDNILNVLWGHSNAGQYTQSYCMIPFERNSLFTGREDEIAKIEALIMHNDQPTKIAIYGLGGMGKTQIAMELAYRIRYRDPKCSIFWISCTSYERVEQAYMEIAHLVGLQDVEPTEAKERVKNYLTDRMTERWLLIYDNADDTQMWTQGSSTIPPLTEFLPQSQQGHILFTTRNQQLAITLASAQVLRVTEVDEETGLKMFQKLLTDNALSSETSAIITLLEQLAFLPLAITQAAAYINTNGINVSTYTLLLQEQESDAIDLLSEGWEDEKRYESISNPVIATWTASFGQIQRVSPRAADYLSFMACISPRGIPQSLLPSSTYKKQQIDAIGLLMAYCLVSREHEDHTLSLHRLVHLATRNWMKRHQQFGLNVISAADRVIEVFPNDDHVNRQLWRQYLPHALSLLEEESLHREQSKYIELARMVGKCLSRDGRYTEAALLFENIVAIQQKNGKDTEPIVELALIYKAQGRLREAEELEMEVLKIRKQTFGPEHSDTLASMTNLASTYWNQGRWNEAEKLEVQIVEISKTVLGHEHPRTLISIANQASTYRMQGRLNEAEELEEQVLETNRIVLGAEHPDTLISMANLASTYRNQGRWKEAENLEVQIVETRNTVLGAEHPDTLTSMANLAATYREQGRLNEAENLEIQVLETSEKILGAEHPDTLVSMANLAATCRKQGRWNKAEELEEQVLATSKKVLGAEHPSTLEIMLDLALIYKEQGRWHEAGELEVEVLETGKKVLGADHPKTLTSMANLAYTRKSEGRLGEALALLAVCCRLRNTVLGPDHPDARDSSHALSDWLDAHNLLLPQFEQLEELQEILALEISRGSPVGLTTGDQTHFIASRTPPPNLEGEDLREVDQYSAGA